MQIKAYAKVNLSLDVCGVREDGYHLLETVMQSIDLYDIVEIQISAGSGITVRCDADGIPSDERNIAYKAAKRYMEMAGVNANVISRAAQEWAAAVQMRQPFCM